MATCFRQVMTSTLEGLMLKTVVIGLTALVVTGPSLASAQAPSAAAPEQGRLLSAADLKAFTDARVGLVKAALQLTPDQEKYWPAIEDAIRARATARQERSEKLRARLSQQRERDPVEFLRERADVLAQRAAGLKRLADAWQPVYPTLSTDQKQRLAFVTVYVIPEMRDAVERRLMMQQEDEDEN
jgi:hypothetical protein